MRCCDWPPALLFPHWKSSPLRAAGVAPQGSLRSVLIEQQTFGANRFTYWESYCFGRERVLYETVLGSAVVLPIAVSAYLFIYALNLHQKMRYRDVRALVLWTFLF